MATSTLSIDNFESTIAAEGITLIDFWAEWCGPCRMFGPIFEAASDENPDLRFVKVDTEAERELSSALRIQSIPTLMIFRDGIQLFSQPGALPKASLDDLIEQVRQIDMDEVRRELATQAEADEAAEADATAEADAAEAPTDETSDAQTAS